MEVLAKNIRLENHSYKGCKYNKFYYTTDKEYMIPMIKGLSFHTDECIPRPNIRTLLFKDGKVNIQNKVVKIGNINDVCIRRVYGEL